MMRNVSQRHIAVILVLLVNLSAQAADPLKPHPHQGIVPPFDGAPPRVTLSEEEEARLGRGEAVLTTLEEKSGGRGTAVRDVKAPPEVVWGRIGAFDQYPDMVPRMTESEVYYRNGNDLRVRMVIRVMGLRYEYFIRHDYQPENGLRDLDARLRQAQ